MGIMGHVLNNTSAYGELLQLVFLYDNLNTPTIPYSVMSIEALPLRVVYQEILKCFAFRQLCNLRVLYIWCILDKTKQQLILWS